MKRDQMGTVIQEIIGWGRS